MKFNADALNALARKIIAKRESDLAAEAREKESAIREYTKAIGNQLAAVRAVAPAAYTLKSHGIKLVDGFFLGWAYDLPEKSDRVLFSNDYGRVVCCGRSTEDVMVAVDFETGKYTVTGQDGELTPDEVAERCRGYCDELFDRLRRLSEGLTRFAEDVAAKISAAV